MKGVSQRTEKTYLGWVKQIDRHFQHLNVEVPNLGKEHVLDFLIHLQNERQLRPSSVNQAVAALRALYRDHLGKDWTIWKDIKIKRDEPLPHLLTREEVARLLATFRDGRYRAYFTVVYLCGLRMSEALAIKPKHIDGERLTIRIVNGKGGKQREVPITRELLYRLRLFWKSHRNLEWLFPGMGREWKDSGLTLRQALGAHPYHMSRTSVQNAFQRAKTESGLMKRHEKLCIHTLRHSYATHMLEGGVSVRQLADYLGHSSLKPTMVYLHLTEISEEQARIALETLSMIPRQEKPKSRKTKQNQSHRPGPNRASESGPDDDDEPPLMPVAP